MLSFEEYKKALGPLAEEHSDEEIEYLRNITDRFAEAVFDDWKKTLKGSSSTNSDEK